MAGSVLCLDRAAGVGKSCGFAAGQRHGLRCPAGLSCAAVDDPVAAGRQIIQLDDGQLAHFLVLSLLNWGAKLIPRRRDRLDELVVRQEMPRGAQQRHGMRWRRAPTASLAGSLT